MQEAFSLESRDGSGQVRLMEGSAENMTRELRELSRGIEIWNAERILLFCYSKIHKQKSKAAPP